MWANNFYKKNADAYYTITSENEEEYDFFEEDMSFIQDNIFEELKQLKNRFSWLEIYELDKWNNDRNYCWKYFLWIQFYNRKGDEILTIKLLYRSWYYEGACLDYEFFVWSYEEDAQEFYSYCNRQEVKRVDKILEEIEKSFNKNTNAYKCTARFSNWEAIYQKI